VASDAEVARIRQLFGSREMNAHTFHGSTSELLDALPSSDATLLSSDAVRQRNGEPVAAQSTLFGGGVSDTISVARGENGLATATAYAEAKTSLRLYDPRLYSTTELEKIIGDFDSHRRTTIDLGASQKISHSEPNATKLKIETLRAELQRRRANPAGRSRPARTSRSCSSSTPRA